jgi:hypothetical protein
MAPQMKKFHKLSELPKLSRNTTAILGQNPEGPHGVQIIPITPVYDNEGSWRMTCEVTGRSFSPIQVPQHFLEVSVCNGQAYKKLMDQRRTDKKPKINLSKSKRSK